MARIGHCELKCDCVSLFPSLSPQLNLTPGIAARPAVTAWATIPSCGVIACRKKAAANGSERLVRCGKNQALCGEVCYVVPSAPHSLHGSSLPQASPPDPPSPPGPPSPAVESSPARRASGEWV